MQALFIFLSFLVVSQAIEPLEWKLTGSLKDEGFSTYIHIGTKPSGGPLQSFLLYLDLETSATLIPSVNCENCKSGAKYDREVSQTEEVVTCYDSYCDPKNQAFCPLYHSPSGQCCANFDTDNCGWDSRVGRFSSSYYAEGAIVKDEFIFSSNRFNAYFVEVLNSTFESIPGTAVGILGMGEKACNPTCIDPIYNSIHESITWASDLFTLCFGYTTGILAIGSNDRRFQNGEILYTTQRPNELGYTYDILDVRLNNHTILAAKSNYVAILKSNQNKILFPKALWTQFKSYMMKHYSHIPNVADETVFIGVSIANITDYPTLDFLVSGILFHLPPEQYFLRDPSWSAGYQLGIWNWDNVEEIGLGLVFLRGYVSVFDQERTGFATANKKQCYGSDDDEAVGYVEWAPTVDPVTPRPKYVIWLVAALGVLVVVVIVCLIVIVVMKRSQKKMVEKFEAADLMSMPLVQTIV